MDDSSGAAWGAEHTEQPTTAAGRSRVEVIHAFGSCSRNVRDNLCLLNNARVAYSVGSRVAITDVGGNADRLSFLSTGLRVKFVSAVACSPNENKRFVAVCYKALGQPRNAYATVYHMPSQPRPSRVKTLSYERRSKHGGKENWHDIEERQRESVSLTDCESSRSSATVGTSICSAVEFVTARFSHDSRLLMVLDGHPEWTLLGYEWKKGDRVCSLSLGSPVHRVVFSPLDSSKIATAGINGHFRIWRTHAGKVAPMPDIAGVREVWPMVDHKWQRKHVITCGYEHVNWCGGCYKRCVLYGVLGSRD